MAWFEAIKKELIKPYNSESEVVKVEDNKGAVHTQMLRNQKAPTSWSFESFYPTKYTRAVTRRKAMELYRVFVETSRSERRCPEFMEAARTHLTMLTLYNNGVLMQKKRYPRTKWMFHLLCRYVALEYEALGPNPDPHKCDVQKLICTLETILINYFEHDSEIRCKVFMVHIIVTAYRTYKFPEWYMETLAGLALKETLIQKQLNEIFSGDDDLLYVGDMWFNNELKYLMEIDDYGTDDEESDTSEQEDSKDYLNSVPRKTRRKEGQFNNKKGSKLASSSKAGGLQDTDEVILVKDEKTSDCDSIKQFNYNYPICYDKEKNIKQEKGTVKKGTTSNFSGTKHSLKSPPNVITIEDDDDDLQVACKSDFKSESVDSDVEVIDCEHFPTQVKIARTTNRTLDRRKRRIKPKPILVDDDDDDQIQCSDISKTNLKNSKEHTAEAHKLGLINSFEISTTSNDTEEIPKATSISASKETNSDHISSTVLLKQKVNSAFDTTQFPSTKSDELNQEEVITSTKAKEYVGMGENDDFLRELQELKSCDTPSSSDAKLNSGIEINNDSFTRVACSTLTSSISLVNKPNNVILTSIKEKALSEIALKSDEISSTAMDHTTNTSSDYRVFPDISDTQNARILNMPLNEANSDSLYSLSTGTSSPVIQIKETSSIKNKNIEITLPESEISTEVQKLDTLHSSSSSQFPEVSSTQNMSDENILQSPEVIVPEVVDSQIGQSNIEMDCTLLNKDIVQFSESEENKEMCNSKHPELIQQNKKKEEEYCLNALHKLVSKNDSEIVINCSKNVNTKSHKISVEDNKCNALETPEKDSEVYHGEIITSAPSSSALHVEENKSSNMKTNQLQVVDILNDPLTKQKEFNNFQCTSQEEFKNYCKISNDDAPEPVTRNSVFQNEESSKIIETQECAEKNKLNGYKIKPPNLLESNISQAQQDLSDDRRINNLEEIQNKTSTLVKESINLETYDTKRKELIEQNLLDNSNIDSDNNEKFYGNINYSIEMLITSTSSIETKDTINSETESVKSKCTDTIKEQSNNCELKFVNITNDEQKISQNLIQPVDYDNKDKSCSEITIISPNNSAQSLDLNNTENKAKELINSSNNDKNIPSTKRSMDLIQPFNTINILNEDMDSKNLNTVTKQSNDYELKPSKTTNDEETEIKFCSIETSSDILAENVVSKCINEISKQPKDSKLKLRTTSVEESKDMMSNSKELLITSTHMIRPIYDIKTKNDNVESKYIDANSGLPQDSVSVSNNENEDGSFKNLTQFVIATDGTNKTDGKHNDKKICSTESLTKAKTMIDINNDVNKTDAKCDEEKFCSLESSITNVKTVDIYDDANKTNSKCSDEKFCSTESSIKPITTIDIIGDNKTDDERFYSMESSITAITTVNIKNDSNKTDGKCDDEKFCSLESSITDVKTVDISGDANKTDSQRSDEKFCSTESSIKPITTIDIIDDNKIDGECNDKRFCPMESSITAITTVDIENDSNKIDGKCNDEKFCSLESSITDVKTVDINDDANRTDSKCSDEKFCSTESSIKPITTIDIIDDNKTDGECNDKRFYPMESSITAITTVDIKNDSNKIDGKCNDEKFCLLESSITDVKTVDINDDANRTDSKCSDEKFCSTESSIKPITTIDIIGDNKTDGECNDKRLYSTESSITAITTVDIKNDSNKIDGKCNDKFCLLESSITDVKIVDINDDANRTDSKCSDEKFCSKESSIKPITTIDIIGDNKTDGECNDKRLYSTESSITAITTVDIKNYSNKTDGKCNDEKFCSLESSITDVETVDINDDANRAYSKYSDEKFCSTESSIKPITTIDIIGDNKTDGECNDKRLYTTESSITAITTVDIKNYSNKTDGKCDDEKFCSTESSIKPITTIDLNDDDNKTDSKRNDEFYSTESSIKAVTTEDINKDSNKTDGKCDDEKFCSTESSIKPIITMDINDDDNKTDGKCNDEKFYSTESSIKAVTTVDINNDSNKTDGKCIVEKPITTIDINDDNKINGECNIEKFYPLDTPITPITTVDIKSDANRTDGKCNDQKICSMESEDINGDANKTDDKCNNEKFSSLKSSITSLTTVDINDDAKCNDNFCSMESSIKATSTVDIDNCTNKTDSKCNDEKFCLTESSTKAIIIVDINDDANNTDGKCNDEKFCSIESSVTAITTEYIKNDDVNKVDGKSNKFCSYESSVTPIITIGNKDVEDSKSVDKNSSESIDAELTIPNNITSEKITLVVNTESTSKKQNSIDICPKSQLQEKVDLCQEHKKSKPSLLEEENNKILWNKANILREKLLDDKCDSQKKLCRGLEKSNIGEQNEVLKLNEDKISRNDQIPNTLEPDTVESNTSVLLSENKINQEDLYQLNTSELLNLNSRREYHETNEMSSESAISKTSHDKFLNVDCSSNIIIKSNQQIDNLFHNESGDKRSIAESESPLIQLQNFKEESLVCGSKTLSSDLALVPQYNKPAQESRKVEDVKLKHFNNKEFVTQENEVCAIIGKSNIEDPSMITPLRKHIVQKSEERSTLSFQEEESTENKFDAIQPSEYSSIDNSKTLKSGLHHDQINDISTSYVTGSVQEAKLNLDSDHIEKPMNKIDFTKTEEIKINLQPVELLNKSIQKPILDDMIKGVSLEVFQPANSSDTTKASDTDENKLNMIPLQHFNIDNLKLSETFQNKSFDSYGGIQDYNQTELKEMINDVPVNVDASSNCIIEKANTEDPQDTNILTNNSDICYLQDLQSETLYQNNTCKNPGKIVALENKEMGIDDHLLKKINNTEFVSKKSLEQNDMPPNFIVSNNTREDLGVPSLSKKKSISLESNLLEPVESICKENSNETLNNTSELQNFNYTKNYEINDFNNTKHNKAHIFQKESCHQTNSSKHQIESTQLKEINKDLNDIEEIRFQEDNKLQMIIGHNQDIKSPCYEGLANSEMIKQFEETDANSHKKKPTSKDKNKTETNSCSISRIQDISSESKTTFKSHIIKSENIRPDNPKIKDDKIKKNKLIKQNCSSYTIEKQDKNSKLILNQESSIKYVPNMIKGTIKIKLKEAKNHPSTAKKETISLKQTQEPNKMDNEESILCKTQANQVLATEKKSETSKKSGSLNDVIPHKNDSGDNHSNKNNNADGIIKTAKELKKKNEKKKDMEKVELVVDNKAKPTYNINEVMSLNVVDQILSHQNNHGNEKRNVMEKIKPAADKAKVTNNINKGLVSKVVDQILSHGNVKDTVTEKIEPPADKATAIDNTNETTASQVLNQILSHKNKLSFEDEMKLKIQNVRSCEEKEIEDNKADLHQEKVDKKHSRNKDKHVNISKSKKYKVDNKSYKSNTNHEHNKTEKTIDNIKKPNDNINSKDLENILPYKNITDLDKKDIEPADTTRIVSHDLMPKERLMKQDKNINKKKHVQAQKNDVEDKFSRTQSTINEIVILDKDHKIKKKEIMENLKSDMVNSTIKLIDLQEEKEEVKSKALKKVLPNKIDLISEEEGKIKVTEEECSHKRKRTEKESKVNRQKICKIVEVKPFHIYPPSNENKDKKNKLPSNESRFAENTYNKYNEFENKGIQNLEVTHETNKYNILNGNIGKNILSVTKEKDNMKLKMDKSNEIELLNLDPLKKKFQFLNTTNESKAEIPNHKFSSNNITNTLGIGLGIKYETQIKEAHDRKRSNTYLYKMSEKLTYEHVNEVYNCTKVTGGIDSEVTSVKEASSPKEVIIEENYMQNETKPTASECAGVIITNTCDIGTANKSIESHHQIRGVGIYGNVSANHIGYTATNNKLNPIVSKVTLLDKFSTNNKKKDINVGIVETQTCESNCTVQENIISPSMFQTNIVQEQNLNSSKNIGVERFLNHAVENLQLLNQTNMAIQGIINTKHSSIKMITENSEEQKVKKQAVDMPKCKETFNYVECDTKVAKGKNKSPKRILARERPKTFEEIMNSLRSSDKISDLKKVVHSTKTKDEKIECKLLVDKRIEEKECSKVENEVNKEIVNSSKGVISETTKSLQDTKIENREEESKVYTKASGEDIAKMIIQDFNEEYENEKQPNVIVEHIPQFYPELYQHPLESEQTNALVITIPSKKLIQSVLPTKLTANILENQTATTSVCADRIVTDLNVSTESDTQPVDVDERPLSEKVKELGSWVTNSVLETQSAVGDPFFLSVSINKEDNKPEGIEEGLENSLDDNDIFLFSEQICSLDNNLPPVEIVSLSNSPVADYQFSDQGTHLSYFIGNHITDDDPNASENMFILNVCKEEVIEHEEEPVNDFSSDNQIRRQFNQPPVVSLEAMNDIFDPVSIVDPMQVQTNTNSLQQKHIEFGPLENMQDKAQEHLFPLTNISLADMDHVNYNEEEPFTSNQLTSSNESELPNMDSNELANSSKELQNFKENILQTPRIIPAALENSFIPEILHTEVESSKLHNIQIQEINTPTKNMNKKQVKSPQNTISKVNLVDIKKLKPENDENDENKWYVRSSVRTKVCAPKRKSPESLKQDTDVRVDVPDTKQNVRKRLLSPTKSDVEKNQNVKKVRMFNDNNKDYEAKPKEPLQTPEQLSNLFDSVKEMDPNTLPILNSLTAPGNSRDILLKKSVNTKKPNALVNEKKENATRLKIFNDDDEDFEAGPKTPLQTPEQLSNLFDSVKKMDPNTLPILNSITAPGNSREISANNSNSAIKQVKESSRRNKRKSIEIEKVENNVKKDVKKKSRQKAYTTIPEKDVKQHNVSSNNLIEKLTADTSHNSKHIHYSQKTTSRGHSSTSISSKRITYLDNQYRTIYGEDRGMKTRSQYNVSQYSDNLNNKVDSSSYYGSRQSYSNTYYRTN